MKIGICASNEVGYNLLDYIIENNIKIEYVVTTDDSYEDEIIELVKKRTKNNYHITENNKGDIVKKVRIKLQSQGKSSERYIVYDDKEIRKELDALVKCGNEWALEFWEDYDKEEYPD